jgi:hydroxyacylglutathione hydrolase
MYLQQFMKEDAEGGSYLIGDTNLGVCAVVDPPLDMLEDILDVVSSKEMRVISVIQSQVHAERVAGCRELARRTGATIYVHERASVEYPHQKLPEGIFHFFRASGAAATSISHQETPLQSPEDQKSIVGVLPRMS